MQTESRQVPVREQMLELADLVAAHAAEVPDSLIKSALLPQPYIMLPGTFAGLAEAAKRDHLSFFATSEASGLARMSLPQDQVYAYQNECWEAGDGAIVRGAGGSSAEGVQRLPDNVGGFSNQAVPGDNKSSWFTAFRFPYGWLAGWSTIKFPNGRYTVQSIVRIVTGHSSTSQAVTVTVEKLGPELAQSFKAPHHGSQNDWHEDVWTKMLDQNPVTIVAPWSLGANFRPMPDDRARICAMRSEVHLAAPAGIT